MKRNWLRAAALALAATTGVPLAAWAQSPAYHLSDAAFDPIAVEPSASDLYAAPPATSSLPARYSISGGPSCEPACEPSCGPYQAACACVAEEAECEPWRLFCQKEHGWNVYGWLSGGIMGNSRSPGSKFNGPVTFADQWTGQFNQAYAIAEKTIDTGGCGFDWGGRLDVLYGTDYIFTMSTGLELTDDGNPKWNSNPDYGLALPQAYLEFGYNDISIKLGHFYTVIGYEVVPATGNFFYTHAYTMQYAEPFTHTGGLVTWQAADDLALVGGFVNGWDAFDRIDDAGMGLFGLVFNATENLTIAYTYGYSVDEPTVWGGLTPRHISSLVATYNRGDWTYVIQNDIGWQEDGIQNQGGSFQSAEWYGVNQYLFYTINDCWKAGLRVEWFRDDDGVRVAGGRPGNPTSDGGFAGNFYNLTAGLNWTPHANWIVRPEIRYDWYDGLDAGGLEPYDDGQRTRQLLFGVDVTLLW